MCVAVCGASNSGISTVAGQLSRWTCTSTGH